MVLVLLLVVARLRVYEGIAESTEMCRKALRFVFSFDEGCTLYCGAGMARARCRLLDRD